MRSLTGVLLLCCAACAQVGCKTVQSEPQLATSAKPQAGLGYIAGAFTRAEGGQYAFVVRGDDGTERVLGFDAAVGRTERTGMTAVPPGTYRVTGWYYELASLGPSGPDKKPIAPHEAISQPFVVAPGHVVFLGSFDAVGGITERFAGRREERWKIRANGVAADEVVEILRRAYRKFGGLPVECLLCGPPRAGTAEAASPVTRPSIQAGTKVVLHYRRPDGDYQGWGLWAWETALQGKELWEQFHGRPPGQMRTLPGFSDKHPAPPAGVDAYGAYWVFDAGEFRDARVNFALVKPGGPADLAEQGFWSLFDSKEAWVYADDGFVYLTRKEADRWH